jgi:hypothetical protein
MFLASGPTPVQIEEENKGETKVRVSSTTAQRAGTKNVVMEKERPTSKAQREYSKISV